SYTCWIIGFRPIMTSGFPGKREDPYRAGITTMTDGVVLFIAERFRELLCRESRGTDHADNDTSSKVGQRRRISCRSTSRQGESQGPYHSIARTGHIVHLACLRGNVPGDIISLVQTHPFFTTRYKHRLAS